MILDNEATLKSSIPSRPALIWLSIFELVQLSGAYLLVAHKILQSALHIFAQDSISVSKSEILRKLKVELEVILVHFVNLLSNLLGNDFVSCRLRCLLFRSIGTKIGANTVIRGGSYIYGYNLTTGTDCQINRNCYFDLTGSITFGHNVVVGHGTTFITSHHEIADATRRAGAITGIPILVEDGVWIGANATILPGVVIGQGSVVAAGAVVTKTVPANVIVAGVPARLLRSL